MGFRMIQPKRIKKVKTQGSQEVLQRLQTFLDDSCDQTAEFLCRFWKDQQNAITYKELRQAVVAGAISTETLRLWQQDYSVLVANRFRNVWEDAMKAGVVSQSILEGKGFVFNTQTPGVMSWIRNRGAALVTSCTEEQKDAISALLSKKMIEGHTVDELSRMIRPCIGLTEGQAKANARYYDSIVANLKKEHPRMKQESIKKKAQDAAAKYAERQHRQRAMTIAQTESAFAYNRGADEGIRQAQEQGFLGQMMKRWSTSGDDAVCSICQGLEGMELSMDEEFEFKGRQLFAGQNLMPPAHPRCACAIEYIEVEGTAGLSIGITQNSFQEETDSAHDRFGILTNNNPSDERYYDYKGKSLQQVEKEIAERKFETAVCFDKNGKAKYAQVGDEDSIMFTRIQLLQMKGADITHNHPLGTPPSPEDLYLMKNYEANSFRTTGKDGTYVLVYSEEVANLPSFKEFSDAYDSLKDEMVETYSELIKHGISKNVVLRIIGDNIWEGLFRLYGVKPIFERR